MGFVVSSKGGDFPLAPAGVHPARCYMVVDLGTQPETFQGKPKPTKKCRIFFELPNEKHVFFPEKGEEPFVLSKKYTASLSDRANLRKDLEAWRGVKFTEEQLKGFDISKLLGVPALLNVVHEQSKKQTGRYYATIAGISPMPKGMTVPPAIIKSVIYSVDEGVNNDKFKGLPEWIQEEIKQSFEISGKIPAQDATGDDHGDNAPEDDDAPPF